MKDTNLIIGKKNTGKTTLLFQEVEYAIENNDNLLIYDDRDEYYKTFSKKLKENNYNVLTLNLKDPTKSNGFNPLLVPYLLYKKNKLDESVSMINNLALEIFHSDSNDSDPFWENMASNYFTGLVLILMKEASIDKINMGSIQVMMNQGEFSYGETTYLKKYLENVDVTSSIYSLLSPIVFAPMDTKGSIISVCKQKLNNYLIREQLLNLINTDQINLKEITQKTAIFIIGNESVNDIANIMIDQLVSMNNSFTYILDNFDTVRKNLSFVNLLKNASYNKNKVYLVFHTEEELKEIYGKYIVSQFDNVINIEVPDNFKAIRAPYKEKVIGNDCEYPLLNMTKHNYFNFKEFMETK